MKIKFKKGIYGFIYNPDEGDVTKIFKKPLSKKEIKTIEKYLSEDEIFFSENNIDDIEDIFDDIEEIQFKDKPILNTRLNIDPL